MWIPLIAQMGGAATSPGTMIQLTSKGPQDIYLRRPEHAWPYYYYNYDVPSYYINSP